MNMKRIKETMHGHASNWAPAIAFFAVFGFTGLVAVGLYRGYKAIRGLEEPLDLSGYEDPYRD